MACVFEKIKAVAKPCGANWFGVASVELIEEAGIFYAPRGVFGVSAIAPTLNSDYQWRAWSLDKNETLVREGNDVDNNHGTFYTVEIATRLSKDRAEILEERLKLADYRLAAKVTDRNGLTKIYRNLKVSFENNTGSNGSPNAHAIRLTAANKRPATILTA